jgi:hypothetical protein
MNDPAPRRDLTEPAPLDQRRFELEWILPLEPGLSTHVALYDLQCDPPHAAAVGEGGDEAEALLDLWTRLNEPHDFAQAVAYVAAAYRKRTGRQPEGTGAVGG